MFKIENFDRRFTVGINHDVMITHKATVTLGNDELITVKDTSSNNYDVLCKNFGFYLTPSINKRLSNSNFKLCIVRNENMEYFILIVDNKKISEFNDYCEQESLILVKWITEELLKHLEH